MEIKKMVLLVLFASLLALPKMDASANRGSYSGSFYSYSYGYLSMFPGGHYSQMNSRYETSTSSTWVQGYSEKYVTAPAGQWAISSISDHGIDYYRHEHRVGGFLFTDNGGSFTFKTD